MNDMIIRAAQDPSCILAVTPDRGGSWWSRLRPPTPRDFKEERMTFTDSYTAQDGIGADDFTLSVDFTLLRDDFQGEINIGCLRCAYYNYTKGYQPSVRILKSDGTTEAFYPVGTSHMTGDIVGIKVIKTGQNVRMVVYARDGGIVRDRTEPLPDGATVTSSLGTTTYPGNISAASIRNDTTGETVWQASHDELYETNPWPSAVPRNFAEEEKSFYDYQAILSEQLDPTHDYSFFMDTEIVSDKSDCPMFYIGGADGVFGLYCYSNNTIRFTTNLLRSATNPNDKYASMLVYQGDARPAGRHSFEGRIEGNIIKTFFDNQPAFTSAPGVRTNTKTVGCNRCNSGYVYKIQIEDLTTGRTVWSYPSEAERVRLLTKTNVRTDRGVFEAADETKTARVDTALDLRGKISSYTVIVDFEMIEPNGTPSKQELAGQGASVTGYPSICSIAHSLETGNMQLSQEVSGSRRIVYSIPDDKQGRHIAAGVVDVGESTTRLAIYLDGKLLNTETFNGIPAGTCDARATNWAIFDNRNGSNNMRYSKIYSALLFDRALTAAEIAALCPTSN